MGITICSKDPLFIKYSHDYDNDTLLFKTGNTVVLSFTSEDPDYGTEVAVFKDKTLSKIFNMIDLASDGRDVEDLLEDMEEEAAALRSAYMATSLYAWFNMFMAIDAEIYREDSERNAGF